MARVRKRTPKAKKSRRYVPPDDILTHLWDADFPAWLRDHPTECKVGKDEYWFDQAAANRAVAFIEGFCRHSKDKMAGKPFLLEPWQKWIVWQLFGWKRYDAEKTRRYRKAFIMMARKNGKSTFIAALSLYLMIADGVWGADVYAAAADKEQARMIFDPASAMVQQDDRLQSVCEVFKDSITYPSKFSRLVVLSSKPDTKHGLNAHGVLIDELHAHKTRELFDVLTTSQGAREQPLSVIITTAGVFNESSICWKEYKYAKRVAENPSRAPDLLPVVFETSDEDDWRDESTWHKANPGLAGGNMIRLDYLRQEFNKAVEDPSYTNTFLQLHLNRWTNQATRWIPIESWRSCARPEPPFPLEGRDCILGVDMSSTTDLTAVAKCFPFAVEEVPWLAEKFKAALERRKQDPDSPEIPKWGTYIDAHFWTPVYRIAQRENEDHADYQEWAKSGHVTLVEENAIDDSLIEAHIRWVCGRYNVRKVCFDSRMAARVASALEKEMGEERIVIVKQGFGLSPACKEIFGQIVSGRLIHTNNPVLTYCANNAAIKRGESEDIYIVKSKSRGRVDGITAVANGYSHLVVEPFVKKVRTLEDMVDQYGGAFLQ